MSLHEEPAGPVMPPSQQPSPQEAKPVIQGQARKFAEKAVAFVNDESNDDVLHSMLTRDGQPVAQNVGQAAATVGQQVAKSAEQSGEKLLPEAILMGSKQLVEVLMDHAIAYGAIEEGNPQLQETAEQALLEAAKMYGETLLAGPEAGKLTEQAQGQFVRGIQQEQEQGTMDPAFAEKMTALARGMGGGEPNV